MSRPSRSNAARLVAATAIAAAAAALAGTGGAVAAQLITSADIKDGTIKTRDIADPAVRSFQNLQGYEIVRNEVTVEANADASAVGTCPATKRALSVSAWFDASNQPAVAIPLSDGTGGLASGHTGDAADTLNIRVICATTQP